MKIHITLKFSFKAKGKSGMVGINCSWMNVNNEWSVVIF